MGGRKEEGGIREGRKQGGREGEEKGKKGTEGTEDLSMVPPPIACGTLLL